jgi:hypothetical protein
MEGAADGVHESESEIGSENGIDIRKVLGFDDGTVEGSVILECL